MGGLDKGRVAMDVLNVVEGMLKRFSRKREEDRSANEAEGCSKVVGVTRWWGVARRRQAPPLHSGLMD
jgi:hypothetical protein